MTTTQLTRSQFTNWEREEKARVTSWKVKEIQPVNEQRETVISQNGSSQTTANKTLTSETYPKASTITKSRRGNHGSTGARDHIDIHIRTANKMAMRDELDSTFKCKEESPTIIVSKVNAVSFPRTALDVPAKVTTGHQFI